MSRPRHCCPANEPDCLNCKFDECYATMQDINRQEAYQKAKELKKANAERDKRIVECYKAGMKMVHIQEQLHVTFRTVQKALSKSNSLQ